MVVLREDGIDNIANRNDHGNVFEPHDEYRMTYKEWKAAHQVMIARDLAFVVGDDDPAIHMGVLKGFSALVGRASDTMLGVCGPFTNDETVGGGSTAASMDAEDEDVRQEGVELERRYFAAVRERELRKQFQNETIRADTEKQRAVENERQNCIERTTLLQQIEESQKLLKQQDTVNRKLYAEIQKLRHENEQLQRRLLAEKTRANTERIRADEGELEAQQQREGHEYACWQLEMEKTRADMEEKRAEQAEQEAAAEKMRADGSAHEAALERKLRFDLSRQLEQGRARARACQ